MSGHIKGCGMSKIVKENAQKSEKQVPEKDSFSWYDDTFLVRFVCSLGIVAFVILIGVFLSIFI